MIYAKRTIIEHDVKFVTVSAAVRYGEEDMPNNAPMRNGDVWEAVIDIENKKIVNWPTGEKLSFFMKVCDEGIYTLHDEYMNEVAKIIGYVPNKLLPGEYGDYLALEIDEDGSILNWMSHADLSNFEDECEEL